MKNLLHKYAPPPELDAAIKKAARAKLGFRQRLHRLGYSISALAAAACLVLGVATFLSPPDNGGKLNIEELMAIWETDQMEVDVYDLVCDIENGNTTLAGMQ